MASVAGAGADTSIQQQIVREAPEIEAYKLDLLKQARDLATQQGFAEQLPGYQVAGFSPAQIAAMRAAEQQGVGAFSPYVTAANQGLAGAMTATREAGDILRGADTRGQFTDAQAAMRQAGAAAAGMSGGINQINTGLGYMDLAGQRALAADTTGRFGAAYQDIGTGINALATSQNMAARASQADLTPATAAIGQGMRGITDAQRMAAGAAGADFSGSQQLLMNAAQRAAGAAGVPQMAGAQGTIGQGLGTGQQAIAMAQQAAAQPAIQQGISALYQGAQQGAQAAQQPGFQQGVGTALTAAQQAQQAAQQPGFQTAQQAIQQGIGAIGAGTQGYDPSRAQAFMDPYRQQVIDETMRQIERQGAIAQQGLSAQAVRAGAFGGEREGVQRAEMQRGLLEQKAGTIANLLSQGYSQAQANAMATFEQQQQRALQGAQATGQLGGQAAQVAAQQAGLGQQAAQQLAQAGQLQASTAGQQAGLGLQAAQMTQAAGTGGISAGAQQAQLGQAAAQIAAQQAGLGVQAGQAMGSLEAQRAAAEQAAAGQIANIGQTAGQQAAQQAQLGQAAAGLYGNLSQQQIAAGQGLGQLGVEQARLGQSAAGLYQQAAQGYGNLASQQGALAGQESNIQQNISNLLMQQGAGRTNAAQALAGIYGQQSGQFQNIAQGVGALAGQQFGIGQQMATGLGALGQQYGQQAINQLGIGQAAQGMQQSDINFLYNVGQAQQAFNQQGLDAQRATQMQRLYAPYQQLGFLSDIYRGAPSTQMATTAVSQPSASPFQQAAGIGLAGLTAAAGAAKAGLFG